MAIVTHWQKPMVIMKRRAIARPMRSQTDSPTPMARETPMPMQTVIVMPMDLH